MSLSSDTIFYSLALWGSRLITFVTAPIVIAYFTASDYGYYSLINTIASFCSIIGLLAIVDQGLPRFFIGEKDDLTKQRYVTTAYFISGAGIIVTVFIIIGSTPIVPFFFKDIGAPILFTSLIGFICLSQSLHYVGSNMLKWTFQSSLFMKITLVQTIVVAVLTIGGVIFLGWRANGVLLANALIALLFGMWANYYIKNYISPKTISKKIFNELALYSWPLLGLNIFAFFTRSMDRIFLASLTSLKEVGIFSVSYTVASIFETLVTGFFFAWGPYMLSTYREKWAPQLYANFFSTLSCIGIISIAILGFWGSSIIMLFRPDGTYHEIGVYIPWVASGTLLYYLGGYFTPGPIIKKKTHWKLIVFFFAATINALLNFILIPKLGILGAGIATTISSLIAAVFGLIISNKLFFVPNKWVFSFSFILLTTAIVSFSQHKIFIVNNYENLLAIRLVLTILLVSVAILSYYKDIQKTRIIHDFMQKISTII